MRYPERTVNMVLDGDAYKIVSDYELFVMKAGNQVVFEKARKDHGLYGYFYKKVA